MVDEVVVRGRPVEVVAADLAGAQERMPVPLVSMGDVLAARNGEVSLGWGSFAAQLSGRQVDAVVEQSLLARAVDAFVRDKEQEARVVYDQVGDQYGDAARQAPSGIADPGGRVASPWEAGGSGRGPGLAAGSGGAPAFGAGRAPGLAAMPSGGSGGSIRDFGEGTSVAGGGLGVVSGPGAVGSVPSGGGLAGIGSPAAGIGSAAAGGAAPAGFGSGGGVGGASAGGAIGAGVGAGRLPGRSGLGKGSSGARVGGEFRGGGSLGKPVSPAIGAMPMGGAAPGTGANSRGGGRGAGAGAGGAGRGLSAGGMLAPMGAHGGSKDPAEADRSSWLVEDDDVWGVGTDAFPSVLRGDQ
jgi:hypothetical protein